MDKALIRLLYAAHNSPFGVVVETPRPENLRGRLYTARREAKALDEELAEVAFIVSPAAPDTELWIVKKASTKAARDQAMIEEIREAKANGEGREPAAESDAVPVRGRLRSPARIGSRVKRK